MKEENNLKYDYFCMEIVLNFDDLIYSFTLLWKFLSLFDLKKNLPSSYRVRINRYGPVRNFIF